MRLYFLQFTLAIVLAIVSTTASADETTLFSPPLTILDGRRLAIDAPPGWHIGNPDPMLNWSYSSYDFTLVPPPGRRLTTPELKAEILQHSIERARLHGDLQGQPFRTASGLRGIIHRAEFEPGTRDWYLTIPIRSTRSAVIVRVMFKQDDLANQRSFVGHFFRRLRFLPRSPPYRGA